MLAQSQTCAWAWPSHRYSLDASARSHRTHAKFNTSFSLSMLSHTLTGNISKQTDETYTFMNMCSWTEEQTLKRDRSWSVYMSAHAQSQSQTQWKGQSICIAILSSSKGRYPEANCQLNPISFYFTIKALRCRVPRQRSIQRDSLHMWKSQFSLLAKSQCARNHKLEGIT